MPKQKPNEQVQQIPLSEIRPFKNHPFKVTDDELMQQTIDSIMQVGVLNPAIIRPAPEGGYEMVAGHRRLHAADLAGLKTIPAIVRNLDDDEAVILMVDSNLQRETISPMERAQAYKMKLEALKHQGKRVDLVDKSTSRQVGEKSWAVAKVGADANESERQVHRYIRLTELLPEVQKKVDSKEIAGTLSGGEQQMLAVGRALMAKPKMILMDEPSMGLSPLLVKEIFAIIQEVNKQGITILLVEQNAKMALAISDRAYVLETGNISIEGNAADLLNDPRVKKAYLGQ